MEKTCKKCVSAVKMSISCIGGGGMCGCWGEGACMVAGGHAWLLGGCMVAGGCVVARGHAWLLGGMRGCRGACMVAGGACVVAGGHAWLPEGGVHGCQGGSVSCDLSHHAFDVACILSPHQLRASSYAPAYILVGHVTCTPPSPLCGQTDACKNISFANFVCGR